MIRWLIKKVRKSEETFGGVRSIVLSVQKEISLEKDEKDNLVANKLHGHQLKINSSSTVPTKPKFFDTF